MSTTSAGQPAATQTERIPLSLNQEFVCLFDYGGEDGPFGPHYHIVEAWRVGGPVDAAALKRALGWLVERTLLGVGKDVRVLQQPLTGAGGPLLRDQRRPCRRGSRTANPDGRLRAGEGWRNRTVKSTRGGR